MADDSAEVVKEQSEAVAAGNLKVTGDAPAVYQNLALGNAVAHQQAMQQLQVAIVGKVTEMIIATNPSEGGADIAALGQLAKLVQGTPPPTNIPTQGT